MAYINLNGVALATESGGTVTLDSATVIPAAGVTGTLPNGVQDNITRLGTVTSGQSQFREESDVVLLGTNTWGSAANAWNLDNVISSTYKTYLLTGQYKMDSGSNVYLDARFRDSSSANISVANYTFIHNAFIDSGGTSRGASSSNQSFFRLDNDSGDVMWNNVQVKIFIGRGGQSTDQVTWEGTSFQWRDSLSLFWVNTYGGYMSTAIDPRGIQVFASASNISTNSYFAFYGLK